MPAPMGLAFFVSPVHALRFRACLFATVHFGELGSVIVLLSRVIFATGLAGNGASVIFHRFHGHWRTASQQNDLIAGLEL